MHSPSLSCLFSQFLAEARGSRSSTIEMRRRAMDYCLAALGDIAVERFDLAAARQLQRTLVDAPQRGAVSTNSYLRMLSPVLTYAVEIGWMAENPLRSLRKLREPRKRVEVYRRAEVDALLAACRTLRHPASQRAWRLRILLAVTAGLRRGEVLNLQIASCDFERGEIWVRAQDERPDGWRWGVKDYEDRKVPLPPVLADALTATLAELPDGQPYVAITPQRYRGCQRLRREGKWTDELSNLPDPNFRKPFVRLCDRAGVPNRTFHGLRATCITWWLQAGVPVHEVRELAGHADIETTLRYYAAIRSDHVRRAADATERIMGSQIGATGLEPATS